MGARDRVERRLTSCDGRGGWCRALSLPWQETGEALKLARLRKGCRCWRLGGLEPRSLQGPPPLTGSWGAKPAPRDAFPSRFPARKVVTRVPTRNHPCYHHNTTTALPPRPRHLSRPPPHLPPRPPWHARGPLPPRPTAAPRRRRSSSPGGSATGAPTRARASPSRASSACPTPRSRGARASRRYRHQTKGEDLPRPGRPKLLLTAREQRHVLRLVEGTAGLSKAQIIQQAGLAVSETTLARFLKEQGVKQRCLKFKKAANSKTASNMG